MVIGLDMLLRERQLILRWVGLLALLDLALESGGDCLAVAEHWLTLLVLGMLRSWSFKAFISLPFLSHSSKALDE